MSIFDFIKKGPSAQTGTNSTGGAVAGAESAEILANLVLNTIDSGVIIVLPTGVIEYINPAAVSLLGGQMAQNFLGAKLEDILKLENGQGVVIPAQNNLVFYAVNNGQNYTTREYFLVNLQGQKKPVAFKIITAHSPKNERIVTFYDITSELEAESEQTEFISTASHEMRTPVASIEGYLGLALNPKTATIDERAKKYLEEAHKSSQHLGKLFRDLLDVTKLDDKRIKAHLTPIEVTSTVRSIAEGQIPKMSEKNIHFTFGSSSSANMNGGRVINQEVFAAIDVDFLREIINNLIENAIKYTNNGGGIWVNVRGDGDRVLINVTDTGIGISPEDSKHVFQKFYRADNSETRTIGGTGLGLYIVKERVEAMSGSTWVESTFGEGSTFYVAFPRLTYEEYLRRKQIEANTQAMTPQNSAASTSAVSTPNENQTPAPMQFPTETTTPTPVAAPVQTPAPAPSEAITPAQAEVSTPTIANTPVQTQAPMQRPTTSTMPVQTSAPAPTPTASATPVQATAPAPTEPTASSAPAAPMTPAAPVMPAMQSNPFLQNSATPTQNAPASPTVPNTQSIPTAPINPDSTPAATVNPVSTPITPVNPAPTQTAPINPAMPNPPITPTNPNILNK
ncbi:MAG: ATP-binding protein [Candidatus Nanosyncoccus sp. P13S_S20_bin.18.1]|nr:ATP-binding protein [Candidatus Nanosyncoccus sp. P13S_S20_bin.18.1]